MNENLICWCFLAFLVIWKFGVERWCPRVRAVALLVVGLTLLQVRSLYDIYKYDITNYQMLQSPQILENLQSIPGITPERIHGFEIPAKLKLVALTSPFFGSLASLLAIGQVAYVYRQEVSSDIYEKSLLGKVKVAVLLTPVFFIVMNTRSTIRILAVMTGSAWAGYMRANTNVTLDDYHQVHIDELGLYTMDLELGCVFQYVAVFSFAHLCKHYIGNSEVLHETAAQGKGWTLVEGFTHVGLQGIYAYVILGVLRCFGNFGIAAAGSMFKSSFTEEEIDKFQSGVLGKVNAMFTFATLLCIYNMFVLDRMVGIREKIRFASIKFAGTRGLLLLAQIQPTVVKMLQSDSKLVEKAKDMEMFQNNEFVQTWSLSSDQAKLWHVSLLSVECLFLVLFNLVMWCDCCKSQGARASEGHVKGRKASAREAKVMEGDDHNRPLLMADSKP